MKSPNNLNLYKPWFLNKMAPLPPTIGDYEAYKTHTGRIEFGHRLLGLNLSKSTGDSPLVTVITIVRNGGSTIERTIRSVLEQTYKNIEYIIIDGGSRDNTIDVVKKYQDKVAYCLSEPDKGIADGFNKGIFYSSGELIGIINSDDWYNKNSIELVVNKYKIFGEKIFHGNNQRWTLKMEKDYVFTANDGRILNRMTINHPTVFVPKTIYEEIGLFRLDFEVAMDYEWLRRAKLSGKDFYYLDSILTNMAPGGLSDKKWLKGYFENAKARRLQGVNTFNCIFTFTKMLFITLVRKGLERVGLNEFIVFYKKRFSIVRKHYS